MRKLPIFLAAVATLAFVPVQAAIIFTVNGTVTTAAAGWNLNDPVTFTWTLAGNTPEASAGATTMTWSEELSTQPVLFANVTGTGLTGTYTRPVQFLGSPYSFLQVNLEPATLIYAGTDAEFIGLYAPNSSQVFRVFANVGAAFGYAMQNPAPSPDTYFPSYLGTYSSVTTSSYPIQSSVSTASGTMEFSPTSFTISQVTEPVPEPGTWVAAALLAGGAAFVRWRKRRDEGPKEAA
ncbi:MAG: PEP-CTERM sorting domain-containing protein [Chthoniobacterales bacterium]|nr:PEP-CTERM sorting domain-containing protein [Chthoniobacterales bacterium]